MTSTVTPETVAALLSNGYDAITTTVGVAVMVALIVLLLQKEIARVLVGSRAEPWTRAFDMTLVPLLVAFLVIITARLLELFG